MLERRLEGRFLCADLVSVDWLEGGGDREQGEGEFRTVEAVLEDISTLGACVQVEERIPLGACDPGYRPTPVRSTPLPLAPRKVARFSRYVSYCAYRDDRDPVGIRFSDETTGKRDFFEPRHLTNLGGCRRGKILHRE